MSGYTSAASATIDELTGSVTIRMTADDYQRMLYVHWVHINSYNILYRDMQAQNGVELPSASPLPAEHQRNFYTAMFSIFAPYTRKMDGTIVRDTDNTLLKEIIEEIGTLAQKSMEPDGEHVELVAFRPCSYKDGSVAFVPYFKANYDSDDLRNAATK